ncbi:MAG TPA: hypothetical protein VKD04_11035 [Burkholderiales bacterium]|nr:hypothetical protein [Burkholderiales bacterium]
MKPTSPEDRELEKISSEVSERYRAGAKDEPPARLDAAVLAAARREVEQPRRRSNWHVPASIAAMLVIGVSLVLLVRDNEPPLQSLDRPATEEAKLAKSAPPKLALKAQTRMQADSLREDRPSRERGSRPDREPVARDEVAVAQKNSALGSVASPAPLPAAADVAGSAQSTQQPQFPAADSSDISSSKKAKALADIAGESRGSAQESRKEIDASQAQPQGWLGTIEALLRDGKEAEVRRQLLAFRHQYPHYPLPERLQALVPPDQR